ARCLKSDAEVKVRVEGCGIELERLSQLLRRLVVAAGIEEGHAEGRVDYYRQRIQLNRASALDNGLLELFQRAQGVVTEPMMRVGVVRLELDRSFVFAHRSGQ